VWGKKYLALKRKGRTQEYERSCPEIKKGTQGKKITVKKEEKMPEVLKEKRRALSKGNRSGAWGKGITGKNSHVGLNGGEGTDWKLFLT